MRKSIIAGNWKMNKTPEEAAALVTELKPLVKDAICDVVVCVPAVDFAAVKAAAEGSNIHLGAQSVAHGNGRDGVLEGQTVAVGFQLLKDPGIADHAGGDDLAAVCMDDFCQSGDLIHTI